MQEVINGFNITVGYLNNIRIVSYQTLSTISIKCIDLFNTIHHVYYVMLMIFQIQPQYFHYGTLNEDIEGRTKREKGENVNAPLKFK